LLQDQIVSTKEHALSCVSLSKRSGYCLLFGLISQPCHFVFLKGQLLSCGGKFFSLQLEFLTLLKVTNN